MSDEPFGRQLKPVSLIIEAEDPIDREYWMNKLIGYLSHQPCALQQAKGLPDQVAVTIYPDANND